MKICFFCDNLDPSGGIGRVVTRLARELSKKYEVSIISFATTASDDFYDLSDITVKNVISVWEKMFIRRILHKINQKTKIIVCLKNNKIYEWIYLPNAIKKQWISLISEGKYDVVIGVQARNAYILGSIAASIQSKTIGWQHSSFEAYLESPGLYFYNQGFLFKEYLSKLDHYIVLNEHDQDRYCLSLDLKVETIYNPLSFSSIEKSKCTEHRFIAVGHLLQAKGFDLLIESFSLFANKNSDWILDIYGDGPDKAKLKKKIIKYGLVDRVHLKGISKNIKQEMLNSSVFLLSSRWEGMPMVVLEALEVGLPIVAFNITAMTPLVTNGEEGYLVECFNIEKYSDALLKISSDTEARIRMGYTSSKKAEVFNIENIIPKWVKAFEK